MLVDVGAAGSAPPGWEALAPHAAYLAFDADRDATLPAFAARFEKSHLEHAAVVPQATDKTTLHLTRYPRCSSTLPPDPAVVSQYLYGELFDVERALEVPATTLGVALQRAGLERIDWLKLDTQGTDLRLYLSLNEKLRSGLLAVDLEPGLVAAYKGEDTFPEVHQRLGADGFWLCTANLGATVRMDAEALAWARGQGLNLPTRGIEDAQTPAPAWIELRYLRAASSLDALPQATRREYELLWCFAMLCRQHGFAVEVARALSRRFGADQASADLAAQALAKLKGGAWRRFMAGARRLAPASLKKLLRNLGG